MTHSITVNNLSFQYPDGTNALDGISFKLGESEKLAVLGANGAGKTTFLHLLIGLEIPEKGTIHIAGEPLKHSDRKLFFKKIGLVFQNPDHQLFCPSLIEDVRFGPVNMGLTEQEIDHVVERALNHVGLWHKRHKEPWRLSYGERKRGALATVLAMNPQILLLDEPSAFLDPDACESLECILRELNTALIITTQDPYLAHSVCSRGIYLEEGRIHADQPISELLSREDLFHAVRRAWHRSMRTGVELGWKEKNTHDE